MEESHLLESWDHTALIAQNIQHLCCVMVNANSKGNPAKPARFEDFHPYRKSRPRGLRLTPENLRTMGKSIITALVEGRS